MTASNLNLDSKVHVANMGPTWVLSAPCGPHAGPWTLLSGKSTLWDHLNENVSPIVLLKLWWIGLKVQSDQREFAKTVWLSENNDNQINFKETLPIL